MSESQTVMVCEPTREIIRQPSFYQRLDRCQTAYLSIATNLQNEMNIRAVRHCFESIRVRTFQKYFKTKTQWREQLDRYIGGVDALIIAVTEDRVLTPGCYRELVSALKQNKLIVVFNLTSNELEKYAGLQTIEKDGKWHRVLKIYVSKPPVRKEDRAGNGSG
jgi:hypothetical protein